MARSIKQLIGLSYKELFSLLPGHYVLVVNDEDFTIAELNDEATAVCGRNKSDCVGHPFFEIFPIRLESEEADESKGKFEQGLRDCFSSGQIQGVGPLRYDSFGNDGRLQRKIWEVMLYPIFRNGTVIGGIVSAHDMTETFDDGEFMSGRLEYLEHLVAASKSKDEFISIASHQLRTPATGVKQYIGMLREGFFGELTPDQTAVIDKAYDSNERQLHIVNDLLKVAQVDDGRIVLDPKPIDINKLVTEVVAELEETFSSHDQTVSFKPLDQPAVVLADIDTIRMVFDNIIDNASKYTPRGGAIDITVRSKSPGPDGYIVVDVADRGVGIPEGEEARLFKKFSRLPNELSTLVGGTGLGLYWAKKIMLLHGGDITYRARRGGGSIFTVRFPHAD